MSFKNSEIVSVSVCIINYEQKPVVIFSMNIMKTLNINSRKFELGLVSYIDMVIFQCDMLLIKSLNNPDVDVLGRVVFQNHLVQKSENMQLTIKYTEFIFLSFR